MRLLALSFFVVSTCAQAQGQIMHEQQVNQATLQQLKHEIEMSRIEAQTDKIRMQTELMQLQMERLKAERTKEPREKSIGEILGEYQAKKAAEAASALAEADREEEADRASARSADTIYFCIAAALPLAFGFFIARRAKIVGGTMKYEEKFGILMIVGALLLGLMAIAISEDWTPRFDVLQNLMMTLRIRLLSEGDSASSPAMIDIQTKHVLLGLMTVAAYGFTTYLGITPAWKKGSPSPDETVESPREV